MSLPNETSTVPVQISHHLYCFEDTCNVYALVQGDAAVLIDFGSGLAVEGLADLGVTHITDVLMTHHHRDQAQGLSRVRELGARVWAPHIEQDLFSNAEAGWQSREIYNNYNVRQDRFALLESVPLVGTLKDYDHLVFGGYSFTVVPTPGHTPGSITLLVEIDGQRIAFSGDLIAAPGRVWSLAATQWTYNGAEGAAASLASLHDLKKRRPDLLLPSHGQPMTDPSQAIDLLSARLEELLQLRGEYAWVPTGIERPYAAISPHVLINRHSNACSYVLLSDSGKALFIDFGYDFSTGLPAGFDRAARRPWLFSLDALKRDYAVEQVEVVIPTHYHDDHVAGFNLLRQAEGTEVWTTGSIAEVLSNPSRFDLPCLWYDPIPIDSILPLEQEFSWHEYRLVLYAMPGHTRYANALAFEVDGCRYLVIGDQYQFGLPPILNYVYPNRFETPDYRSSAALLRRLKPDVLLTGHWNEQACTETLLADLEQRGEALERLHGSLLAEEVQDFGAGGCVARITPYQVSLRGGESGEFQVELNIPAGSFQEARLALQAPPAWLVQPVEIRTRLKENPNRVTFTVTPPPEMQCRRARLALDVTIGARHFGQVAEALVDVL